MTDYSKSLIGKIERAKDIIRWATHHDSIKAHVDCTSALKDLIEELEKNTAQADVGQQGDVLPLANITVGKNDPLKLELTMGDARKDAIEDAPPSITDSSAAKEDIEAFNASEISANELQLMVVEELAKKPVMTFARPEVAKRILKRLAPYLSFRTTEPVTVSLEKCGNAAADFLLDKTLSWHRDLAKAVLDAAGVAYGE